MDDRPRHVRCDPRRRWRPSLVALEAVAGVTFDSVRDGVVIRPSGTAVQPPARPHATRRRLLEVRALTTQLESLFGSSVVTVFRRSDGATAFAVRRHLRYTCSLIPAEALGRRCCSAGRCCSGDRPSGRRQRRASVRQRRGEGIFGLVMPIAALVIGDRCSVPRCVPKLPSRASPTRPGRSCSAVCWGVRSSPCPSPQHAISPLRRRNPDSGARRPAGRRRQRYYVACSSHRCSPSGLRSGRWCSCSCRRLLGARSRHRPESRSGNQGRSSRLPRRPRRPPLRDASRRAATQCRLIVTSVAWWWRTGGCATSASRRRDSCTGSEARSPVCVTESEPSPQP